MDLNEELGRAQHDTYQEEEGVYGDGSQIKFIPGISISST